jgi:FkbM family methyltransferase
MCFAGFGLLVDFGVGFAGSAALLVSYREAVLLEREPTMTSRSAPSTPASTGRPIGNVISFLQDVRARGFTPTGILDVGANRGEWTRMALSIYPSASVVMIEPQDEMDVPLLSLCRERPSCHHVKAGAGRIEGELIQTISDDLAGSSFLLVPDDDQIRTGRQRRTRVLPIDSILAQYPEFRPGLVKLDIQGFELEALMGGNKLFETTEVFIIETSLFSFMKGCPITREVISFMADRGYEIYDFTEYGRRPYDGALGQVDIAFVKSHGLLRSSNLW